MNMSGFVTNIPLLLSGFKPNVFLSMRCVMADVSLHFILIWKLL